MEIDCHILSTESNLAFGWGNVVVVFGQPSLDALFGGKKNLTNNDK